MSTIKAIGWLLVLLYIVVALVRSMFTGTFPDALLALSIGGALGVAWAWWDEKKKERKT